MNSLLANPCTIRRELGFFLKTGSCQLKPSNFALALFLAACSLLILPTPIWPEPLPAIQLTSPVSISFSEPGAANTKQLSRGKLPVIHILNVAISQEPRDRQPPFDLRIQLELQFLGNADLTWASTQLTFPNKQSKVIGGALTCANRPKPALTMNKRNRRMNYRFRSSNIYGMDFDWRLYQGQHEVKLNLFSDKDCAEESLIHTSSLQIEFIP